MKSLEEMIEVYKEKMDFIGYMKSSSVMPKGQTLEVESVLTLLLELKQRREQDLSLEMLECLKFRGCKETGNEIYIEYCEQCKYKFDCGRVTCWLNEQEARLKGLGEINET